MSRNSTQKTKSTGAKLNISSEAQALTGKLRELASEPSSPTPVIKTELPFYGVKVGDLRKLARSWTREHADAAPSEVIAVCDRLWKAAVREEMVLACFILGYHETAPEEFGPGTLDAWRPLLDNWETTDQLGSVVVGPWVAGDPQKRFKELERLAKDDHPWSRRLGLVGTIKLTQGEDAERFWPRVGRLVLKLSGDREAAMPKAISWALRKNLRNCESQVAEFVEAHAEELPAVAVRETRNKLKGLKKTGH